MAGSRKRRRWPWLIAILALLAVGYAALHHLLQPERISAFLLRQASDATGLQLALGQPASVGLFPDVHIELHQLTATAPNSTQPLLQVERVDAVLPWSSLGGDSIQLQRLRLVAPALDTAALTQWLATREQEGPPAPIELPQLQAEMVLERGSVVAPDWSVNGLELRLSSLQSGQPATLALAGTWARAQSAQPFDLQIDATPHQDGGLLRFDPLTLTARNADAADPVLRAEGWLQLAPPTLQFDLRGSLPQWPSDWPALPLPQPQQEAQSAIGFEASFHGITAMQGALELILSRADASVEAQLEVGDVLAWIESEPASPLPPLQGTLRAATLQIEGIRLQGVQLQIDAIPAETETETDADAEASATDATR